jgi:DNA-binding SARP family transcriptional activator
MGEHGANLIRLYLPLLNHPERDVSRQAYTVLLCSHGPDVVGALRRLTQDPDAQVRREAHLALQNIAAHGAGDAPAEPLRDIYVTCLGSLRLGVDGAVYETRAWASEDGGRAGWQKVQATFAFLVHSRPHSVNRRVLGEAVWGTATSASSLARTLTSLRQALARMCGEALAERLLLVGDDRCWLDPELFEVDVAVFERTYALASETEVAVGLRQAAPLYAQVMELYRGPYLSDVTPGSGWMYARRDLLNSYYLIAAERLAEDAYTRADYRRCILVCMQALGAEPTADDIVTWMLRAYARLGHYGELEYAFRSYVQAAGIDPATDASQDVVIKTYREVIHARAVNDGAVIPTERSRAARD